MNRLITLRRALMTASAAIAVLALAACGAKSDGMEGMDHGGGHEEPAPSTSAAFNSADVMFAQMMIPHHRQAVEMAVLAETRAQDPEVKALAAAIKGAQDPEIATLTGWLTAWGQPLEAPTGHGSMPGILSAEDMENLAAASGTAFDRAFSELMIAHHEGAITMAEEERAKGQNPDAVALAGTIATAQTAEIEQMRAILARL
ncbi:DUF305 domain-containing protein [Phytomonospora sp. NPDC050363]|uniref:DUF305 domain-containing protein n=1 Tax=Phytomonospora sp. NPDC050363 TaxID=3155642 RepID=UPI00340AE1E7